MYPGISDLINDFFGTHFSFSFPPTFGTLVAISFLLAAWTLGMELKRKEKEGLLRPVKRNIRVGESASAGDLLSNALFGFVLGFKVVYAFSNSDAFFEDPQHAILSTAGNLPSGIAVALLFAFLKYREKRKAQLSEPKTVVTDVYPHQMVSEFTMVTAATGLLGAKIFHILEYWKEFVQDPAGMFFSGNGLTMYGGLIVGGAGLLWYARRQGIPVLHMCDAAAPGIMLAYGTGRLGCQLSGDGDWGLDNLAPKPAALNFLPDWAWAYNYPHNVINQGVRIPGCDGHHCFMLEVPVYPTPLYESVVCILLFFVIWAVRKKVKAAGNIFSLYLLLNGLERLWIESIRVNSQYTIGGFSFTQAQLIAVLLIISGISGLIYFSKKKFYQNDRIPG
jgi:phosphatidylglycerol---prolipoprotein diacylglyceryl transferase